MVEPDKIVEAYVIAVTGEGETVKAGVTCTQGFQIGSEAQIETEEGTVNVQIEEILGFQIHNKQ